MARRGQKRTENIMPKPKKQATPTPAPTTPQPTATAPAPTPTQPIAQKSEAASKQRATINKLRDAWTARGVDLSKLTETQDGKFINVVVAEGWPIIRIGASGGVELPQVRSYAKAFDAAIDGLAIFQKQQARDQKKQGATAAKPATPANAPAAKQTPTVRKQKQDAAVEAQLQSATA